MKKRLEINKDYAEIFGLDPKGKGQHMIYKGCNKWLAQQPSGEKEIESEKITLNALEYINRASVHMGPTA